MPSRPAAQPMPVQTRALRHRPVLAALMALAAMLAALLPGAGTVMAQDSRLVPLETADQSRGFDAVGRLNLGSRGFCTGALIAPDLVLTAAHCLFDRDTGARIDPAEIEFLAGWRNGRAAAYRRVKRGIVHPDYVYAGTDDLGRVSYDLALLQLDQPIRLPALTPFETAAAPVEGERIAIVSYARDRAEAPSLQDTCRVLERRRGVLVMSCSVDFGSSGAPVFHIDPQKGPQIVSVVSAKAQVSGEPVALGTPLQEPLARLMAEMATAENGMRRPGERNMAGGAKFISVAPSAP